MAAARLICALLDNAWLLVAFHFVLCPFVVIFQMVTIPCCHLLSLSLYTRNMTSVEFFHPTFTLYNVFVSSHVCWACPQNMETILKTLLFVPNVPICFVSVASLTLTPPQEEEKAAPSASKKPAKGRPLLSREKSADSSSTSSSASAEKQRQEARKRLLAAKKAASFRQNSATESADSIEIYVPEAQTRLWRGREDRQTDRKQDGQEREGERLRLRRWQRVAGLARDKRPGVLPQCKRASPESICGGGWVEWEWSGVRLMGLSGVSDTLTVEGWSWSHQKTKKPTNLITKRVKKSRPFKVLKRPTSWKTSPGRRPRMRGGIRNKKKTSADDLSSCYSDNFKVNYERIATLDDYIHRPLSRLFGGQRADS